VGDLCILRTPDGLRAVPKSAISKVEAASKPAGGGKPRRK
jgi:hypothetical protein